MQTLQDFNSDPTPYINTNHTINPLFVKTAYASVVSWIQYVTYTLSDFILHNDLFHYTTLWITRNHLPTSLKVFCFDFISNYLPTSWTFTCKYLTQPMLENASLLISITFKFIKI